MKCQRFINFNGNVSPFLVSIKSFTHSRIVIPVYGTRYTPSSNSRPYTAAREYPPPYCKALRTRTRAKPCGNGCCVIGGWAARNDRRVARVCNVRHVGHGVLNQGGRAEPQKKRDRQRATKTRASPALCAPP